MTDVMGVNVAAIVALREEYRREMDCQIVHDSWHQRAGLLPCARIVRGRLAV